MRKITLLFSFFAFTFLGYGQYLTEGFEGATIPPAGWTHNQTSATETWEITTTVFHSGSNAATVNYHATDAQDETLVTPSMDLSSATSPRVRFWFSMSYYWSINPNDNYDFKVSVKDNTTSTTTEIWTEASQGTFDNFTWYEVTLDLTAYAGKNDIQIEFNYSGTDGAALYFDDIIVEEAPTCEVPTALTVANIGTTSVDIGWTASTTGETAWEYVVQAAGGSAPSGAGTGTSTNPTNVTGLTANTAYEFYVRADCTGGDYSSWVGPMAFTTACDTFTAPYSEDFENTGAIPNCWTMSGGEDWLFANTGSGNHIGNNGTIDGTTTSGGYFAWVDSSGAEADAILESPFVDVSGLTTPALSFYELSNNEGNANSQLVVEIWDGAAWNTVGTYNTNTNGWEEKMIDLSSLTFTGAAKVRFTFTEPTSGDFYDDIAIDDVKFYELPTCLEPTNLISTNIGTTSVDIGWTASTTGETAWEYVVQAAGGSAPSGAGTGTSTNPTNITGLTANTAYEFYVRADCTGGDYSSWVGPMAFTTACNTFTAPYSEDFENAGAIPNCWTMSGGENWLFANTGTGNHIGNDGTIDGATTSGGYFAWVDSSGTEADAILESSFVDVSGLTTPALSFYELSNNEGNANSQLVVEIWDGAAWNTVGTYNTNTNGWEEKIIDLSSLTFTGVAKVRFTFTEPTSSDFYDDIAIDDVKFYELPTCLPPTNITATPTSTTNVDITWTAGGSETNWSYEYGATGFTQGTGTSGTTTSASLSLTTLTESATYDVYIQANCGGGNDSAWTTVVSWTQPPPNDTLAGAIPITPSAAGTGCTTATFTLPFSTDGTTDSGMDGTCNTTSTGLDQFFTWTATTDGLLWNDDDLGNPGIIIRDTSGNEIACAPTFAADDTILSGWTIGDDLIIQIYDFGTSMSDVAFCLEEYTLPPAPECATNLMPTDTATDVDVAGSTITLSWDAPTSGVTPTDYEIFWGTTSGSLSSLGTTTNTTVNITNVNFSTTYYWMLVPKNGPASAVGCAELSFTTEAAPPIPSNDDCANATNVGSLPFNETMDATSATNNSGFISECTGTGGMNDGVWYTFTTVNAGTIDIAITGVTGWDPEVALYSGSCGTFTCVDSADSGGTSGDETLSGVTVNANTQYWINIGHFDGTTDNPEGSFTIDISTTDTTVLKVESNSIENFTLFPTVVKDNLSFTSQEKVDVLTIYNITGQEVLSRKPQLTNGNINVSSLSNGMYIVKVKAGNSLGSYKIIKK